MAEEVLTLILDDMYELGYAEELCNEIGLGLQVTGQMVPKERTEDYGIEDIRYQTEFSGESNKLKYLLHLLTWRMESVKLYNRCLTKDIEVETNTELKRNK